MLLFPLLLVFPLAPAPPPPPPTVLIYLSSYSLSESSSSKNIRSKCFIYFFTSFNIFRIANSSLGRLSMKTVSSPLAPLFSISASSSLPSAAAPSSSSFSLASSAASSISPSSWTNSSSSSAAFFLDVDLDLPLYADPLAGAEAGGERVHTHSLRRDAGKEMTGSHWESGAMGPLCRLHIPGSVSAVLTSVGAGPLVAAPASACSVGRMTGRDGGPLTGAALPDPPPDPPPTCR